MTRALDYFDLAREYDNDPAIAFSKSQSKYLVISSSDWRFSPERSREIVNALISAKKMLAMLKLRLHWDMTLLCYL